VDYQSFEEQYLDVLQNLEFGIIQVARRHPEMSDWEALVAVEALMQVYRAEAAGREARPPKLDPLAEETFDIVEGMCEWRLGRGQFVNDESQWNSPSSPSQRRRCTSASSAFATRSENGPSGAGGRATSRILISSSPVRRMLSSDWEACMPHDIL